MGRTVIPRVPPRPRPTRIEYLKELYAVGRIDLDYFEEEITDLLKQRLGDLPREPEDLFFPPERHPLDASEPLEGSPTPGTLGSTFL